MTPEESRIVILENALVEAYHSIDFLHGCLTEPDLYKYEYPKMTLDDLREWKEIVEIPEGCIHGRFNPDCDACRSNRDRRIRLEEARSLAATEKVYNDRPRD